MFSLKQDRYGDGIRTQKEQYPFESVFYRTSKFNLIAFIGMLCFLPMLFKVITDGGIGAGNGYASDLAVTLTTIAVGVVGARVLGYFNDKNIGHKAFSLPTPLFRALVVIVTCVLLCITPFVDEMLSFVLTTRFDYTLAELSKVRVPFWGLFWGVIVTMLFNVGYKAFINAVSLRAFTKTLKDNGVDVVTGLDGLFVRSASKGRAVGEPLQGFDYANAANDWKVIAGCAVIFLTLQCASVVVGFLYLSAVLGVIVALLMLLLMEVSTLHSLKIVLEQVSCAHNKLNRKAANMSEEVEHV